ncbi:hypothetical protein SLV14_000038 [Streptomyces sp. Je 1-4]|nr:MULTISPECIES: hypothetical protein [unclassified Streptomyces]UYB37775.1 hypothetical protein SLV14_000038 [Streptomyces sp. Je 1-4]UZQ33685.1 hypothetical protein SLV14N_000038 [Streptomyces sp. Je 1-4] [Streptomyces sp. Je 1-4 4N24]UZQ41103.1 hypothetical protein SLV14NA_000038 [Streptomyces sp. Je 1-4] [Streptomyces sp. Je 1-4 4N24_ara]
MAEDDRRQDDRPQRDELQRIGDAGVHQHREQGQAGEGDDDELGDREAQQDRAVRQRSVSECMAEPSLERGEE